MFSVPLKPHTLSGPVTDYNKGFNDVIGADGGSSPSVCSEHATCYLHTMCGDQTQLLVFTARRWAQYQNKDEVATQKLCREPLC